ncbi:Uncharacterized protein APZ42_013727 [Daphnia magna]|uniref:RNase H type-1 domain-containing protein n=1 Tax=Daphnia magna TaxID=35525 RepID=A0A162QK01_9CRUS|nr:Uncharacterized protein APZ42_013727 [Daphnia magna]
MARYLLKLRKNPKNSTYQPAYHHINYLIACPPRSIPNISPTISELAALEPNLFKAHPYYFTQRNIPPPWSISPHKTSYFPMQKKEALENQIKARVQLNHALKRLPHSTIIEGAWYLTPGSNIQTAEPHGLLKALEACYHLEPGPLQIQIFTDSQSAFMAIDTATKHSHNPVIQEIWNLLHCQKNVGTHTHLTWIPSHIGIPGNEVADRLASDQAGIPLTNKIHNTLTVPELIQKYKKKWSAETLIELKNSGEPCLSSRVRLGVFEWHHHPIRSVCIALHRLRSGHNKLNSFLSKLDMDVFPLCRHECPELEDTKHVLFTCKFYHNLHASIKQYFMQNQFIWEINTLLGLNMSLDKEIKGHTYWPPPPGGRCSQRRHRYPGVSVYISDPIYITQATAPPGSTVPWL